MKINLPQAVKYFFSNPSLELVFIESIANSMDAEATEIDVNISIQEFSKPETLEITIKDNGVGITDDRFAKFSKLLEVDENSHKGIGRLVFLSYFKNVGVESRFNNKQRTFKYWNEFDEKSKVIDVKDDSHGTVLTFKDYFLQRIKTHDYIRPSSLKKRILEEFYPRLYLMKKSGEKLKITISLSVEEQDNRYDFYPDKQSLEVDDIEVLSVEPVDASLLAMFETMDIHYSIKQKGVAKTIVTALCIDGRTYKVDIISDENIPIGYEIILLLYSTFFDGKTDPSRQELTLDDSTLKNIKKIFQKKVSEILLREIPIINQNNIKTRESLTNTFPHLIGYFDEDTIGFIKRDESIRKAQDRFFKAQRDVLEANNLSDETYEKSIELSSRALVEYILYRQIILHKLKAINSSNCEADIHNLIVPKRKKINKSGFMSDLYSNNVWLLDDKYMTFNTILSEKEMSEVIKTITNDDQTDSDDSRPDITLVFSNDPVTTKKVDVVVVELKKRDLLLADNLKVKVQLEQRARKLLQYYPDKIQRMWYYGVVEFNDELKLSLYSSGYAPLFSTDTLFYKEEEIMIDLDTKIKYPVGFYILSIDAFIQDADARNSTFLQILKKSLNNERQ